MIGLRTYKKTAGIALFSLMSFNFAFGFSPLEVGSTKASFNSKLKSSEIKTGVFHLGHYHQDFQQNFYSLDVDLNKRFLGGKFKFDGFALFKVEGEGETTFSIKELYQKFRFSRKANIKIGRALHEWTSFEDFKPAGLWNNTWDFNKALPSQEGLFGAFVDYAPTKKIKITFFASPVSLPKLASHYDFKDQGGVEATTLWFSPPPKSVTYSGDEYQTKYFLDADVAGIALSPQAGVTIDWSLQKFFIKNSYLYGPAKDLDLAIDFVVDATSPNTPVDTTVIPNVSNVHRMGLDFGRNWNKSSKTVLSANYKKRDSSLAPANDRESNLGLSSGAVYQLAHAQAFLKGRLKTVVHFTENTEVENLANGELGDTLLNSLSVPFRYRRGLGLKTNYSFNSKYAISTYTYYDTRSEGVLGDVKFSMNRKNLSFSVGANFIEALSKESEGFYRDFRENDSYYMGASYVF